MYRDDSVAPLFILGFHQCRRHVNSLYQDFKCVPIICTPEEALKLTTWKYTSGYLFSEMTWLTVGRVSSTLVQNMCSGHGPQLLAWWVCQATFPALSCWFFLYQIQTKVHHNMFIWANVSKTWSMVPREHLRNSVSTFIPNLLQAFL